MPTSTLSKWPSQWTTSITLPTNMSGGKIFLSQATKLGKSKTLKKASKKKKQNHVECGCVVVYTFNASTQEEEAGGSLWVQIWAWVWSVCTARPYLKQTMQKMDFKKPFRGQMLVAHTLSPVFRQTNKQKHTKKATHCAKQRTLSKVILTFSWKSTWQVANKAWTLASWVIKSCCGEGKHTEIKTS